jgi:hypothetical protein
LSSELTSGTGNAKNTLALSATIQTAIMLARYLNWTPAAPADFSKLTFWVSMNVVEVSPRTKTSSACALATVGAAKFL